MYVNNKKQEEVNQPPSQHDFFLTGGQTVALMATVINKHNICSKNNLDVYQSVPANKQGLIGFSQYCEKYNNGLNFIKTGIELL